MRTLKFNHALMSGASLAALMKLVLSGPALYRLMTDVASQPGHGSVQVQTAAGGADKLAEGADALTQTGLPKDKARVGAPGQQDPAADVLSDEIAPAPAVLDAEQKATYDALPRGAAAEVPAGLVRQQQSFEKAAPQHRHRIVKRTATASASWTRTR